MASLFALHLVTLLLTIAVVIAAHVHVHERGDGHAGHGGHKERADDAWNSIHYKDGQHNDDFDHEAIIGNKKEATEFQNLTPEESKKRLKILVTKGGMDANGDGYVTEEELKIWVLKSFRNLAEEEGLDRFEEEDLNEDGYVTWAEHIKDNFDIDNEFTEAITDPENAQMIAGDRELWKVADTDGDKSLSKKEFPAFNAPEEFEHMHDIVYELTLKRRDKNNDGYLDLMEFIVDDNGQIPDQKSETYISEKDKFIKDYDVDKDGKLNKKEVLLWIIPDNNEMAEQEAEHLIITSDSDGDGKLSVQEIVDHHDIFVGSEATDYGERLANMKHDEL